MCIAIGVVELALFQHPAKRHQAKEAKAKADRDQDTENVHKGPYFKRSALSDTVMELDDMAKAAISGEHSPATASGTASTL